MIFCQLMLRLGILLPLHLLIRQCLHIHHKVSDTNRGLITVITLIAALVLSRVGVVTLIEQGYSYLSYGFILFYLLPTLLVGGYKIIKHKDK